MVDTGDVERVEDMVREVKSEHAETRAKLAALERELSLIRRVETVIVALLTALLGLSGFDLTRAPGAAHGAPPAHTSTSTSARP